MEELRLLDRWWHVSYSARRLGEFAARCHEREATVIPLQLAIIRGPPHFGDATTGRAYAPV
jgi:hypothetical protein